MAWQGFLGIFVFLGLVWAVSENRTLVKKRQALAGIGIQILLAILLVKIPLISDAFAGLSKGVDALKSATQAGTTFLFGYLGGGEQLVPVDAETGSSVLTGTSTFIFALQALPMIMVVSALSMVLFHWRVLPVLVKAFSKVLQRSMNIGGALGVTAAAKVFLGNIEAPLLVRPYLKNFSRSELFTVMTCGMATTSATVMALYSSILQDTIENPIAHILTASIISIPAAITVSRILIPQTSGVTSGEMVMPYEFSSSMDAVAKGTSDGLHILMNVGAMLIVALAIVALANSCLGLFPDIWGEPITLQRIFGFFMAPITWLMGIPWAEAQTAGQLLGAKTVMNEVVAFLDLSNISSEALSEHSKLIMTYALCGFANLSAIGIMIGGIGAMVPERRSEIVSMGFKSMFTGTLATCLSGTVVGLITRLL